MARARPSVKYSYRVSTSAPNVVTTQTLNHSGAYLTTQSFYDGLLRERQTQTNAVQVTTARLVTATMYDTAGRAWKTHDAFYAEGTPSTTLIAAGDNVVPSATRTTFDAQGRPTADIALSFGDEEYRTTTVYDGAEHTTVIPPAGGTATTTITDVHGQTVERRSYTNAARTQFQTATYGYDIAGNMTRMTDAAGNTWSWSYDARGNRTSADDPDTGVVTTAYDVMDRPETVTDARGTTLTTAYDELGRRTTVSQGEEVRARFAYDTVKLGQLSSSTSYQGGDAYVTAVDGYTARYQPTSTTVTIPDTEDGLSGSYTWSYTYNQRTGMRESVRHPAMGGLPQERVTTVYNAEALPVSTTAGSIPLVVDGNYDPLGRMLRTTYGQLGEHVYDTRDWDDHTGRLTRRTVDGDVALRIEDTRYTYDAAGNVRRIAATSGQDAQASTDNQCFALDALGRLTNAWTTTSGGDDCAAGPSSSTVGGSDGYWHSYTYDLAGNRATETRRAVGTGASTVTHTYTTGEQGEEQPQALRSVTTAGGPDNGQVELFDYDASGNLTSRRGGDRDQALTWDAEGRLATVTEGDLTTEYVYGADGNRLIARNADDTSTVYLPEGNELTATANGARTGMRYYTHGEETIAVRDGSTGRITYLFADPQGTALLAVAWGAAQAVQRRRQLPFGEERGSSTSQWPGDRGFLGATSDPTGTTHLNAREYDPVLGRFISADPLLIPGDPRQHNAYQYGAQNPVTFSDPSGEALEECWSGQYACSYDRRGAIKDISFGKNYHRETVSRGGTPSPRWEAQQKRLTQACRNDPGCAGTPQQITNLARARDRAAQIRAERAAAEARRQEEGQRSDSSTASGGATCEEWPKRPSGTPRTGSRTMW
ncbi:RHS repeat-associated core domain-containing protein [Streptomyces sp. 8K308]|uniref:RHS repeat domain-containing protein n=1 Tax=Streptomyces sp. 8K308 TaxID=2530388 RepID=UPI0014051D8F|nr:RHS repeat-associated core domain-containing protein [Streptomyces sp. 8K308]